MIGIIAAMDIEVVAFKDIMDDAKQSEGGFWTGKIANHDVVLARSGVGKVGAAITTTSMIKIYSPKLIINIGSAGSLKNDVLIGDVVIASDVAFHDVEVPGWPKGFDQDKTCFHADKQLLLQLETLQHDHKYHIGPMVSGDSFIMHKSQTDKILKEFPQALCVEMEAAAVGQCASFFKLPFLILRAISDITIQDGNDVDFETFVQKAAVHSAEFTKKFITELD